MAQKITWLEFVLIWFFKFVNLFKPWHKLPWFIGIFNLLAYRIVLDSENLHDTYSSAEALGTKDSWPMKDTRYVHARHSDGEFNDLKQPKMGSTCTRFGRNVKRSIARKPTDDELLTPNPRVVADKLLTRTEFKPAKIVNLLAAAWIQFQVHDWAIHDSYIPKPDSDGPSNKVIDIPLPDGTPWPSKTRRSPTMKLPRSVPDKTMSKADLVSPAYQNIGTAWWDASQIYGETEDATILLREDAKNGKLKMTGNGADATEAFLPRDENGLPQTGFNLNWWLGLELLHTLFAKEHNAICDMLIKNNPTLGLEENSDKVFDTARIINCALIAKIHTVEWTPAILQHPSLEVGMNANWWGLMGERLHKLLGPIGTNEIINGLPGSGVDHHGAPYSLTEEFVSVYRLHPLIPENIAFFNAETGKHTKNLPMKDVAFEKANDAMSNNCSFADALYSFGVNYPGAITHNNHPNFLRDVIPTDGVQRDMACVDIMRDRERGVPRYCEFRRQFHMKAPKTFEELTGKGKQELANQLREVYGNIEKVDLMVGMFCEPLPEGFGFSDTAFRVFILMATRRIKSDRFLAGDAWGPTAYTKEGIDWVQNETMKTVLCRHFPKLSPALTNIDNAFKPWTKIGATGDYKGVETN